MENFFLLTIFCYIDIFFPKPLGILFSCNTSWQRDIDLHCHFCCYAQVFYSYFSNRSICITLNRKNILISQCGPRFNLGIKVVVQLTHKPLHLFFSQMLFLFLFYCNNCEKEVLRILFSGLVTATKFATAV